MKLFYISKLYDNNINNLILMQKELFIVPYVRKLRNKFTILVLLNFKLSPLVKQLLALKFRMSSQKVFNLRF